MRRAQIVGVCIALSAAAVAFLGMRSVLNGPLRTVVRVERAETVPVLVAETDLALGQVAYESSFRWQEWPETVSRAVITQRDRPAAAKELWGHRANPHSCR
jgi:Flp pilus assembly protein CpaB